MGFGKDGKGQILYDENLDISLGALAAKDVASQVSTLSTSLTEDFRIIKVEYFMKHHIPVGEGTHIIVGIADGALTAAEIEEAIEANPTNSNDVPASEQVMRAVFPLEHLHMMGFQQTNEITVLGRTGAQGEKSLRWTFPNATGWQWFVYNRDDGALTTGGRVEIFAKYFGVWVV